MKWPSETIRAPFIERMRIQQFAFLVYILLLPVSAGLQGIIGSISLLNYPSVLMIGAGLVQIAAAGHFRFRNDTLAIHLYFIYTLLSCLWFPSFRIDYYFTTFALSAGTLIVTTQYPFTPHERDQVRKAVSASALVVFLATLLNYESVIHFRLIIVLSSYIDPNDFACGLCVILGFFLEDITRNHRKGSYFAVMGLLFIVLLSGSRGAMIMAVGELGWWLFSNAKSKWARRTIAVLSVVLILLLILSEIYLPEFLRERMDLSSLLRDGGAGRMSIWKAALEKYADAPVLNKLFGYGHGSFRAAVNYIAPGHEDPYEAHNMFINALIEGGLTGLLLLLAGFIQTFALARRRGNLWGQLALIGFMIEGLSLDAQSFRIFGFVFAIAIVFSVKPRYAVVFQGKQARITRGDG